MLTRNEEYVLELIKEAPGKWVNDLDIISYSELPEEQTIYAIAGLINKNRLSTHIEVSLTWLQVTKEG